MGNMEPIFSLIILLSVVAADSEPNTKNGYYRTVLSESGNQPIGIRLHSPQPFPFRNYLVTPPPTIKDINHGRKYLTSRNNQSAPEILSSPPNRTSSTSQFKSISHLKLRKTDDSRIVIRENYEETSKKSGKFGISSQSIRNDNNNRRWGTRRKRQPDRTEYNAKLNDKMDDSPDSYEYYPELNDEIGERYYYKEFPSEGLSQMVQYSRESPQNRYQEIGPRRYHQDSCKKYLEFLKYAFQQLDSVPVNFYPDYQDDYYYYDGDYTKPDQNMADVYETKPPNVISPNMAILHKMAVSNFEITPNDAKVYSDGENDTKKRSSELPETSKSTTTSLSDPSSSDVLHYRTESIESLESMSKNQQPNETDSFTYRSSAILSDKVNNDNGINENCADKLFPCPDNINVTYPVNGFCNRFVVCESGKPHPEFCPDGLHFNLIKKQCDLPHNSFCTYSCPAADGYFAIPGDCGGFFRCSNWYPEYRMCPPLMHWDNKAKICTFQGVTPCPMQCNSPNEVKPYRGVQNAYVICTRNVPSYYECPSGSYFNKEQLRCELRNLGNLSNDETYMTKNRGIGNGKETLCAHVELDNGRKARWCQEIIKNI